MKKNILLLAMIMITVSGSVWGQKAVNKADILLIPGWKQIYDAYTPDAELIARLKTRVPGLQAEVYFGFWCEDSKNNLPLFLKIIDALNEPGFKIDFYEVAKKSTDGQMYYVEGLLVQKVPTFIFYANDIEMGRIIENPKETILQDMENIFFK